jgi:cardiolipin synthase
LETLKDVAEGFQFLETVDHAFEIMLQSIEAARSSIRLEIYIYRASPIGERFREALIRALGRGVTVKVMVDALGSVSLPEKFWDPLIEAGGRFRWFNPLKLKRLGFRDHRKILVVDEKIGFVGGFNIAPEYQGDGVTTGWHDVGIRVPESLARALAASFELLFPLADYKHRRLARYRRSAVSKITSTPDGQLITSAPGRGPYHLKTALVSDLQRACSINIISAYFLPPRQIRRALLRAPRQGRKVRIILPAKSDVRLSQMAARFLYRPLLRNGVEIYEYQPQILHTKLFLFDDVIYVGSANMDKRSLLVNYELLIRAQNPELAHSGREFFEKALDHCKKIEWETWKKGLTLWNRLQQQWAYFVLSRVDPYLTRLQLSVLYREWSQRPTEDTELLNAPEKSLSPD